MLGPLVFSTDLDGTLLGRGNYRLGNLLPTRLLDLDVSFDIIWVINTGRRWNQLIELVHNASLVRLPDYLVERETFLYVKRDGEYIPVEEWNAAAHERLALVERTVGPHLPRWSKELAALFPGVKVRLDTGVPLSVQCLDVEQSPAVRDTLSEWTRGMAEVSVIRNGVWVGLWVSGLDKGTALGEIARRHGVPTQRVMAIGDSENDMPMLHRSVAGFPAVPDNAETALKRFVTEQGGYVSPYPDIDGVLDSLERFLAPYHTGGEIDDRS